MMSAATRKFGTAMGVVLTAIQLMVLGCSPGTPNSTTPSSVPGQSSLVPSSDSNLAPLFHHIWRLTKAPATPPLGSILIFLPNGGLLETSCVETYRIATWSADNNERRKFTVVEDRLPAYSASILELNEATLRLEHQLSRSREKSELTYSAVDGEFVCPDLPR